MIINQVAAQLYTLRDYLKTPKDIASSFKKVKAIGYEAVQLSGLGPIGIEDLKHMLDQEGLICCATHEPGDEILRSPGTVVDRLNCLDCKYTAYPYPTVPLETLDDVKSLAVKLNDSGKVLCEAGISLTYHNHHIEFQRIEGSLILDMLYDETDRKNLAGEIDTYWVQYGGGSPLEWCRKLRGRLPLLHLKDYGIGVDLKASITEIGYGNLNWKAIIAEAEKSGCEWFIVEQDTCLGNPFESLRMSYEYIRENLC